MNLKYILIIVILAAIVGGGILAYQYWQLPKEEAKMPEISPPERKPPEAKAPEPYFLKAISPNGGEEWIKGKNYTIQWDQKGLEIWGNKVTICLTGTDIKGDIIQSKYEETLCYAYFGAYLITETILTENKYQWKIPEDISERFEEPPSLYKISLLVFDTLPPEGRTEWAGLIWGDESDDYFSIIDE